MSQDSTTTRVPILAVIGSGGQINDAVRAAALEVGARAMAAGFRVATGGLGGVMAAVSEGARSAPGWREGMIIGVTRSYDREAANPWVDVVVPTGMEIARNVILVAMADVVLAIEGGAGTLSELALAWQLERPIVALESSGGWAERITAIGAIDRRHAGVVLPAETPAEAVSLCRQALARM